MKNFKFFERSPKYGSLNNIIDRSQNKRNYYGLNKGVIKWTNLPTCQIYYINQTMGVDPVHEYNVPEISMNLVTQTITLNTLHINTFDTFMTINSDRYIIISTIHDINGNVYDEHNQEHIPRNQPLIIRCAILD
jgi:hypothetical protein